MAILFLYRLLYFLLSPILLVFIVIRLFKKKESLLRLNERLGVPFLKRPTGKLIWFHGASVGECLSMLPLINKILESDKHVHIMVTSGTVTSAELMKKRLPKRAFHQFIPLDGYFMTKRFVKHWHPQAVLWFESDFWPSMLDAINKKDIPLILLNGRISNKSFLKWQKHPYLINYIQSFFTFSFGQTNEDANRLKILGAKESISVGNLKFAAVYPPFDSNELKKMRDEIGGRPSWCMASTHPGEEEMGLQIHQNLKQHHQNILTIIVPRHPGRVDALCKMFQNKGLTVARRSLNDKITPKTDVYFADTIGEMGLLYQLSNYVFVGGSLVPFGGQNMLEPMRLQRTVFVGPYAFNFTEIVNQALSKKALIKVENAPELARYLSKFFLNPTQAETIAHQGEKLATSEVQVLDRVYQILHKRFNI